MDTYKGVIYAIPPCFNIYKQKTPVRVSSHNYIYPHYECSVETTHSFDITVEPGTAYLIQLTTQEGNSTKYVRESCSNRFLSGVHHIQSTISLSKFLDSVLIKNISLYQTVREFVYFELFLNRKEEVLAPLLTS